MTSIINRPADLRKSKPLFLKVILFPAHFLKILTSQQEGTSGEIPVRTCQADSSQTTCCMLFPGMGKKKVETDTTRDFYHRRKSFNVKSTADRIQ